MSISKKVFWIFLSIILVILALGVTIYVYQLGNKRMHSVLHALLEFNTDVYKVRELQQQISAGNGKVTAYDLHRNVSELKISSGTLADSVNSMMRSRLDISNLEVDINNYYKAITEFIDISVLRSKQADELITYFKKLHDTYTKPSDADEYDDLENIIKLFIELGRPEQLKKINGIIGELEKDIPDGESEDVLKRMHLTLDSLYVTRLNLIERKEFLDQSSKNFLHITSRISDQIKERDKRMNMVLSYSASAISILSIVLAMVYWSVIRKYIKRFLANQSEVMNAIKNRTPFKEVKPFSNDELGNLTHKMWEMAEELRVKDVELRQSEEKYRTYIDTSPLAVVVFDGLRQILEVNPGALLMLGYDESEMLGTVLDTFWHAPDGLNNLNHFRKLSDSGRNDFLIRLQRKDDVLVYTNVSAIKLSADKYVAFCQDITERIRLETELKNMNEDLLDRVKVEVDKNLRQDQIIQQQKKLADMGMMVSAIAHQWRQPLNALALCVQDVLDEFESGVISQEYLVTFEENSMKMISHMSKTIDDFRDFFLPDKNVTNFNVVHEIKDLMRLLSVQILSRNIDMVYLCKCSSGVIQCNSDEGEVNCLNGSNLTEGFPGEFKQVMINLIYNSVDSIEERRLASSDERGRIEISVNCSTSSLVISVCDNGSGISDQVFQRIFEPYFTTKPEGKGTGIGLYMSKAIIENHMNGRIYGKQRENGACFVIELPVVSHTLSRG